MADVGFDDFDKCPETLDARAPAFDWDRVESLDKEDEDPSSKGDDSGLIDSMLCDPGSRLIRSGFTKPMSPGKRIQGIPALDLEKKKLDMSSFYLVTRSSHFLVLVDGQSYC